MSRFVGDYKDFRKPGEPRPLVVARDLLEELGVYKSSRAEQERAVREWLRHNDPSPVLAVSLEDAGFLPSEEGNDPGVLSNLRQTNPVKRARTGTDGED